MYQHEWPRITEATRAAVLTQLDLGEISIYGRSGIFAAFEDAYADSLGRRYALMVSSGTAGMHTAMVAAGFAPGDEVICPAYTFFATVTPIFQTGAVPVLCDAGPDGNSDPEAIAGLVTARTRAIIVTHMWGQLCDLDAIGAICRRHRLTLIEDCSHAHGAVYRGRPVGSYGDIAVFSLQGQKIVTGGEGGIVLTNDVELHERAVLFGQYNKRCLQELRPDSPYREYAVTGFGLKLRAHPFAVAMAYEQFGHLAAWHAAKQRNAAYLTARLADRPELVLPGPVRPGDEPAWYAYTFRVRPRALRITVSEFCAELVAAGVTDADMPGSTSPLNLLKLFQDPALLFPAYAGLVAYRPGDFPMAEAFFDNAVKLPVGVDVTSGYRDVLDGWADAIEATLDRFRSS